MKHIELTQNKSVGVDDEIYNWLRHYNWHFMAGRKNCYGRRCVKVELDGLQRNVYIHRLISGFPPPYRIGFKNGNSLDCCIKNLRIQDSDDNIITWRGSCGISHFKGVFWDGWYGLWRTELDKMIIGYSITEIEAAMKYNEKAKRYLPGKLNDLTFLCAGK